MFAKQTLLSASLVGVLVGCSVIAQADPATPAEPVEGAARVPTGSFELSAGFATDENFIAGARVAQDSLFGTGHSLSLDARLSARRQRFRVDYTTADLGDGVRIGAELFDDRRQLPGFVRHGSGVGLTLSQQVTRNLRVFMGYRYEHVVVEADSVSGRGASTSAATASPLVNGAVATLRAGAEYNSLDRLDMPLRGTSIGAVYEVADKRLGSDFNFDRVHAWVDHHRPLGPFTLHLGAAVTQIGSRDGSVIPRSERLFLDGSRDIRGFAIGALGPVDGYGTALGGSTKFTGRAELEVPLIKRAGLSAVAFFDAGGIASATGAALGHSVGVGLIWRSPIGALRFDIAFPIDGGGKPQFLFGAGGDW